MAGIVWPVMENFTTTKKSEDPLRGKGISFHSDSDAEVMLQALAYWGIEATRTIQWHVCLCIC